MYIKFPNGVSVTWGMIAEPAGENANGTAGSMCFFQCEHQKGVERVSIGNPYRMTGSKLDVAGTKLDVK